MRVMADIAFRHASAALGLLTTAMATPVDGNALGGCGIIAAPERRAVARRRLRSRLAGGRPGQRRRHRRSGPHGRHRPASIIKVLVGMASTNAFNLNKSVVGTAEDGAAEGTKVWACQGPKIGTWQVEGVTPNGRPASRYGFVKRNSNRRSFKRAASTPLGPQ